MTNTPVSPIKIKVQNFKARYVPFQDRILFEVLCSGEQNYRFWITRKIAQKFFADVDAGLSESITKLHSEEVGKALKEFELQRAKGGIKKSNSSAQELAEIQMSEPPKLIMRIDLSQIGGVFTVNFFFIDKQTFSLNLSQLQIAKMHAIFLDRQEVAGWHLNLEHAEPVSNPEQAETLENPTRKKTMH